MDAPGVVRLTHTLFDLTGSGWRLTDIAAQAAAAGIGQEPGGRRDGEFRLMTGDDWVRVSSYYNSERTGIADAVRFQVGLDIETPSFVVAKAFSREFGSRPLMGSLDGEIACVWSLPGGAVLAIVGSPSAEVTLVSPSSAGADVDIQRVLAGAAGIVSDAALAFRRLSAGSGDVRRTKPDLPERIVAQPLVVSPRASDQPDFDPYEPPSRHKPAQNTFTWLRFLVVNVEELTGIGQADVQREVTDAVASALGDASGPGKWQGDRCHLELFDLRHDFGLDTSWEDGRLSRDWRPAGVEIRIVTEGIALGDQVPCDLRKLLPSLARLATIDWRDANQLARAVGGEPDLQTYGGVIRGPEATWHVRTGQLDVPPSFFRSAPGFTSVTYAVSPSDRWPSTQWQSAASQLSDLAGQPERLESPYREQVIPDLRWTLGNAAVWLKLDTDRTFTALVEPSTAWREATVNAAGAFTDQIPPQAR